MKKIFENWIAIVFIAVIYIVFLATCFVNGKEILSSSHSVSTFDSAYTDNVFGKSQGIELLGFFNRIIQKKEVIDADDRYTVYKMNNGQLTWNYKGYDTTNYAYQYIDMANKLNEQGIPLLYVQVPFKINKYDNQLPYGITDETNPLADNFLDIIQENGCNTLDLRKTINMQGLVYSDLFYDTDHHWKPETGLWATGIVTQELNQLFDLGLYEEYLNEAEYTFTTYDQYMLGSEGKRTGRVYSGLDDFTLITPNYETSYTVSVPSMNLVKTGDYTESLLCMENLKKDFEDDPGRVYTGDNYSLMTIENHLAVNDKKLLLIKDSFSKTVIPFLASTCRELDVIDMRTYTGTISEYVAAEKIDAVVVLYNPSVVVNDRFFEFE